MDVSGFANVIGSTIPVLSGMRFFEGGDVLREYGKGNSLIFYAPRFDGDDMDNLSSLIKELAGSFHPDVHKYVLYQSNEYTDFTLCAFQDGIYLGPLKQVLNYETKTVVDILNHSKDSGKSVTEVMEICRVNGVSVAVAMEVCKVDGKSVMEVIEICRVNGVSVAVAMEVCKVDGKSVMEVIETCKVNGVSVAVAMGICKDNGVSVAEAMGIFKTSNDADAFIP
ncbi:hypothetical protein GGI08_001094 [Coemansia sp. S2]|nr:hypothetical protein GGI08_001094 [Coemansia sp. S2]KAJ2431655.1 hypothetical protein GGF41_000444 [Coemansia sp. RSA 2531]